MPTARLLVEKALQKGVLINNTGEHTIRLIPPLVVTKEQIDRVVKIIGESSKSREACTAVPGSAQALRGRQGLH